MSHCEVAPEMIYFKRMVSVFLFKEPPRNVFTILDVNGSPSLGKDIDWGGKQGRLSGNYWNLAGGKGSFQEDGNPVKHKRQKEPLWSGHQCPYQCLATSEV